MRTFIEHVIIEQELRMDRELQNILMIHAKDYKLFREGKQELSELPHLYNDLV